jgi:hypothetical protein
MRSIRDIQEKLFMLNDKIKWAEMFLAHAKAEAHEMQEMIFDIEEDQWLEKIANQNRSA